jgi:hypothetical protein
VSPFLSLVLALGPLLPLPRLDCMMMCGRYCAVMAMDNGIGESEGKERGKDRREN